jgi:hypothetical protein
VRPLYHLTLSKKGNPAVTYEDDFPDEPRIEISPGIVPELKKHIAGLEAALNHDHESAHVEIQRLRARVAELEEENQILKNAEADLRAFATLCRESAKKILGLP